MQIGHKNTEIQLTYYVQSGDYVNDVKYFVLRKGLIVELFVKNNILLMLNIQKEILKKNVLSIFNTLPRA